VENSAHLGDLPRARLDSAFRWAGRAGRGAAPRARWRAPSSPVGARSGWRVAGSDRRCGRCGAGRAAPPDNAAPRAR